MNDPTGGSRAKRLAEQLKELWDKPTTAECLRLSHAAVTEQPAPHPDTKAASRTHGGGAQAECEPLIGPRGRRRGRGGSESPGRETTGIFSPQGGGCAGTGFLVPWLIRRIRFGEPATCVLSSSHSGSRCDPAQRSRAASTKSGGMTPWT